MFASSKQVAQGMKNVTGTARTVGDTVKKQLHCGLKSVKMPNGQRMRSLTGVLNLKI